MRFGNAAWGLRETPLEKQLQITQAMGLDLLELSIANYDEDVLQLDATDEQIAEVKALYAKYGVSTECGCSGDDFTNEDVADQVARMKKVIVIASKVGIKKLRIFSGFNSDSVVYGERLEKMLSALSEVKTAADAVGVELCVETHGGVACNGDALVHFNSTSTRVDCLKAIVSTGVSLNYDPANLAAVGGIDPIAFYGQFKDAITYVHLKDFKDVEGGVKPCACGEGRLDWPSLMATLKDYDGPALFEYELPEDVEDGLKRCLDFVRKF